MGVVSFLATLLLSPVLTGPKPLGFARNRADPLSNSMGW